MPNAINRLWTRSWRARRWLRYRNPAIRAVTRAARAVAYRLKPWGVIEGGTDCDGMRSAGASLYWTRASAETAVDHGYEWSEGPYSAEVVSGSYARQWRARYEPDTRDRFAEHAGY